jgi:hypothetical protein
MELSSYLTMNPAQDKAQLLLSNATMNKAIFHEHGHQPSHAMVLYLNHLNYRTGCPCKDGIGVGATIFAAIVALLL